MKNFNREGATMLGKQAMNDKYKDPDPFGVQIHPDDAIRKQKILDALQLHIDEVRGGEQFMRALDIGCGEGWITQDIPADHICGLDISDVALSRCDSNITKVNDRKKLKGTFDCIIACGVLVNDYDFKDILEIIESVATDFVLTCQAVNTEVPDVLTLTGKPESIIEFPYRDTNQRMRIFNFREKKGISDSTQKKIIKSTQMIDEVKERVKKEITDDPRKGETFKGTTYDEVSDKIDCENLEMSDGIETKIRTGESNAE